MLSGSPPTVEVSSYTASNGYYGYLSEQQDNWILLRSDLNSIEVKVDGQVSTFPLDPGGPLTFGSNIPFGFGMEIYWEPDSLAVLVDGVSVLELNDPALVPSVPMYANFTRYSNPSASFEIDFINVGTSATTAGDYDRDGDVDGKDFLGWQRQFGDNVAPPGSGADGNSDGTVNTADYVVWQDNFGAGAGTLSSSITHAPEAGTVGLLLSAGAALSFFRLRRQQFIWRQRLVHDWVCP